MNAQAKPDGVPNRTVILDAGAQYRMDIEQNLKRQGYFAERMPIDTPIEELGEVGSLIISGGPHSVYEDNVPLIDPRILEDPDMPPILGICYGAQLINYLEGGSVEGLEDREDGPTLIDVDPESPLFHGLTPEQRVLMSHGDTIVEVAEGYRVTARSGDLIAGISNEDGTVHGVQFHPEVLTANGAEMFKNFMGKVCGIEADYEYGYDQIIEDAIAEVRETVGDKQVLAYVSGGVDSMALAKLLAEALPAEQLFLVYVDHGMMRKGETEQVKATAEAAGIPLRIFDASKMFLDATTEIDGFETVPLKDAVDPEIKRKIIGDKFITLQDKEIAVELGLDLDNYMLGMGTLHTDLMESGSEIASALANKIKSHHNDTEAVRALRAMGRVLEPWRYLQKDDVRAVAKKLGLPEEVFNRQPFPGPGFGIRIICAEGPWWPDESDAMNDEVAKYGNERVQANVLPIRTVGLQGDHRTYGHLVSLSGKPEDRNWKELISIADNIPRKVHGVNRVCYVFGEPVTEYREITPTHVTEETLGILSEADAVARRILTESGLDESLSQVPIIAFPVNFGEPGKVSIAIRTFITNNFKTGEIAVPNEDIPENVIEQMVEEILQLEKVSRVVYDLSSKPPGTTEWE